ncbi:MAG TPA: hypothetical protein DIT01_11815 [Lentisphaeria bacterium]|nr:hypothetical protein [Lentisphaeria bacterium]
MFASNRPDCRRLVLPIFPVETWEKALRQANYTRYGLTGSVWTRDEALGRIKTREGMRTHTNVKMVRLHA